MLRHLLRAATSSFSRLQPSSRLRSALRQLTGVLLHFSFDLSAPSAIFALRLLFL